MEKKSENLKFQCAFSQKSLRNNKIICITGIGITILAIGYVCIKVGGVWICLTLIFSLILLAVYLLIYADRMAKESYIEITADGLLKCFYKGRNPVSYPIKEIVSIEEASLEQAAERYATLPVVLNTRGWEVYPQRGVLITFNRAWIKSVFPVYFNPADIQGLIAALKQES